MHGNRHPGNFNLLQTKMKQTVLITGATGSVGSELLRILSQNPAVQVKAAVRNIEKAAHLQSPNGELTHFDFEDKISIAKALQGVDSVFILPPAQPDLSKLVGNLIAEVKKAQVKKMVHLIGFNTSHEDKGFGKWHADALDLVLHSGIPFVILEPVEFMKNYLPYIQNQAPNVTFSFAQADAKKSLVAPADIAQIAANVLLTDTYNGQRIQVSGYNYDNFKLATIISNQTGKVVTYQPVDFDAFKTMLLGYTIPEVFADALVVLNKDIVAGKILASNRLTREILGRAPVKFGDFVKTNLV